MQTVEQIFFESVHPGNAGDIKDYLKNGWRVVWVTPIIENGNTRTVQYILERAC